MRHLPHSTHAFALALALAFVAGPAAAQSGDRAVRRMQLQLQALQQQLQDAQAAQAKAEADKAESDKKLAEQAAELPKAQASVRESQSALKQQEGAKAEALAKVDSLQKELEKARRDQAAAVAAKDAELESLKKTQAGQLSQLYGRYEDTMNEFGTCTDKNQRLLKIGAELLERYRRKGFAEIAKQKDPFLGLGDVEMFNLVQDYHDRLDAEQLLPAAPAHP